MKRKKVATGALNCSVQEGGESQRERSAVFLLKVDSDHHLYTAVKKYYFK